jgi:hypothetical protein
MGHRQFGCCVERADHLDVPARLTRSARRRHLRLPTSWPWVDDLVAVFARIAAIPLPA